MSICVNKKYIVAFLFLVIFSLVVWWSVEVKNIKTSYNSRAEISKTACEAVGKYDIAPFEGPNVTPAFVQVYYENYCKKNETNPLWNGGYGEKAKCYTATLICGNNSGCNYSPCIANISDKTRCLYQEVSFDKCILAQKAPSHAAPEYSGSLCTSSCYGGTQVGQCLAGQARRCICEGMVSRYIDDPSCISSAPTIAMGKCTETCYGGIAVGLCGFGRRCVCEGTIARFRDDLECKTVVPVIAEKPCQYGGGNLSVNSSPYRYDASNFCIIDVNTGKYNGYICITEDEGKSFIKSTKDSNNICVNPTPTIVPNLPFVIPNTVCGANHDKWMKDKAKCSMGNNTSLVYGTCTTDKQWICRCDDDGKYAYPVLRNKPEECNK